MLADYLDLFEYNRWANRSVLAACEALTEEELQRDLKSSFPSVAATLLHIHFAEWIWLQRWMGDSPTDLPVDRDLSTLALLVERWEHVDRQREEFLGGLSPEELTADIPYRNTAGDPFVAPLNQLLRHVVNHSTYHRGQIVTMLRQLGTPAPSTDLVLFHRERAAAVRRGEEAR